MKSLTLIAAVGVAGAAAFILAVPRWNPLPWTAEETSIPGNAVFVPVATGYALNKPPPPLPPAAAGGPSATETYKNVKVLTDVSAAEFMRLQYAITDWVAPKQGCDYCHVGTNYAADDKPQKNVARIMLQMTRHLNADWDTHVGAAGMTCYTCHRGQPIPGQAWFPNPPKTPNVYIGHREDWQESADTVRKFFPDNGWAEYFFDDQPIAVNSETVEPGPTLHSWPEATRIYEMMMQMTDGIGVNCGFCHQSRAFNDWNQSTPYRWNAWWAIRMTRDLNKNFLVPVWAALPQTRTLERENDIPVIPARFTGPQGGNGLVVCATCHLGLSKPMNGANMVHDYPGLAPARNPASAGTPAAIPAAAHPPAPG